MSQKYLLYIDILGFSDLVKNNPSEIEVLYEIINSLNVHKHDAFQTIVFSDTILVYNKIDPTSIEDHRYLVMYAIEFVQDLMYRLSTRERYFRALLTYGEFKHYTLSNIECYYGSALVNCYYKEKEINGMGLFIDKQIENNRIFPTINYDKDLDFVLLLQSIERLNKNQGGELPLQDTFILEQTDEYWSIKIELMILRNIYKNATDFPDPKIRGKFLQTYNLYKIKYPKLFTKFEFEGFVPETITQNYDWSQILKEY
jgi:hypothetical protein